jgi:hypothetical protein
VDVLRGFLGHLFDVHAALGRGDEGNCLAVAVNEDRQIQFLGDVGGIGDQHQVHRQGAPTGLVSDHLGAEHALGCRTHLVQRLAELDAAGLAATACMDLCLDHPLCSAQCLGRVNRLVGR